MASFVASSHPEKTAAERREAAMRVAVLEKDRSR